MATNQPRSSRVVFAVTAVVCFLLGYVVRDFTHSTKAPSASTEPELSPTATMPSAQNDSEDPDHEVVDNPVHLQSSAPTAQPVQEFDPLTSFKEWLAQFRSRFESPGQEIDVDSDGFYKKTWVLRDLRFDVQQTTSLVSPYVATFYLEADFFRGKYGTFEQAEKSSADQPLDRFSGPTMRARIVVAYQDRKWVPKDVHYDSDGDGKRYISCDNILSPRGCYIIQSALKTD